MWNANKNADQKKSPFSGFLWWTLIFVAAWWMVGVFMSPKQTAKQTDTTSIQDISNVPVSNITSDKINASVQGLRISDVKLSDFTVAPDTDENVVLMGADDNFIEVGLIANGTTTPVATTVWKQADNTYTWRNSDGVEFTRSIVPDGYTITITDTITNKSGHDASFAPYARVVRDNDMKSASGVASGAVAYVNSDVEDVMWQKLDKKSYAYSTTNGFAGFVDQYWETIVSIDTIVSVNDSVANVLFCETTLLTPAQLQLPMAQVQQSQQIYLPGHAIKVFWMRLNLKSQELLKQLIMVGSGSWHGQCCGC